MAAPPQHPPAYPPPPGQDPQDPALKFVLPVGRTPLSIIAGYAGLFALLILPAPLALLLGIWALVDLRSKPEKTGAGRAWFAVVTGLLGSALLALMKFS